MSARRLVLPEGAVQSPAVELEGDLALHVRSVLRLGVGAPLVLSDGAGVEAEAEISAVARSTVTLRVGTPRTVPAPPGLRLTLIQAVGKGDKVDAVVRQATELGVRRIVPVLTERTVGEKRSRVERWRAIAEDAVRVSGRPFRPAIEEVAELDAWLSRPRSSLPLALAPGASRSLGEVLDAIAPPADAEVLIGPEGGLEPSEVARIHEAGFLAVHLGAHVLRTETAGPAVAAMLLFWAKSLAR